MAFRFKYKTAIIAMAVMVLFLAVICNGTATKENMKYEEAKTKATNAGNEAFEAGKEAKESTESWTGWAKDKITEGLGLKTEEAKEASRKASDATIDSAKSAKDKITG